MEIRLNKLISDSGLCSRREADKFIEMGRVTVNGELPVIGQRVTENDVILVDGEQVRFGKRSEAGQIKAAPGKSAYLIANGMGSRPKGSRKKNSTSTKTTKDDTPGTPGTRREHYGRYNKYAAARHAAKERDEAPSTGKAPKRSAVAQQMAASPKSAALRKTSRNNPINIAKRKWERRRKENNHE